MSKFAVYAGHGGNDPGAVSGSRKEKDYTLKVAMATTKLLRNAGHTVINNRTSDVDRSRTADATRANNEKVDAVIEIHLNSNAGTPATGCETYHVPGSTKGQALAKAVNDKIAALGVKNRGVKTNNSWTILTKTTAPAILVETAFINNDADMAKYDSNVVASAIAAGIISIYGGSNSSNQNGSSNNNSSAGNTTTPSSGLPYFINVTAKTGLNVRSGPGTTYSIRQALPPSNVKYTIVEEKNGWGKLKSGAGWIYLQYTKKVG